MKTHYQLNDQQFEEQFENCTFDPTLFTHEAHLRLAWIHLTNYGMEKATQNICQQIQKFDRIFGDGTKFHYTITVAAIKVLAHFKNKSSTNTFEALMEAFPRLKTNFQDLLDQHYSAGFFKNKATKYSYLEPDLLAF